MRTALLFGKPFRYSISLTNEDSTTPSQLIGTFSSYFKEKKLNFFNNILLTNLKKELDLKQELHLQQDRLAFLSNQQTQRAQELLHEEITWKDSIGRAEKRREEALSDYVYQFLSLNAKISQTKKDIMARRNTFSTKINPYMEELDGDNVFSSAFQLLEDQRRQLKTTEASLREATNELNVLKEKPQQVAALVKMLKLARDDHRKASSRYHIANVNWLNFNKGASRVNDIINLVTKSNQTKLPQWIAPRFWINIAEMAAILMKHRKF